MNAADRIAGFFGVVVHDPRITSMHICIYLALCSAHFVAGQENPFSVSRRRIMQACKILGNATYHRCMKDLHQFGYIEYVPSYHPVLGSLVTLRDFPGVGER